MPFRIRFMISITSAMIFLLFADECVDFQPVEIFLPEIAALQLGFDGLVRTGIISVDNSQEFVLKFVCNIFPRAVCWVGRHAVGCRR